MPAKHIERHGGGPIWRRLDLIVPAGAGDRCCTIMFFALFGNSRLRAVVTELAGRARRESGALTAARSPAARSVAGPGRHDRVADQRKPHRAQGVGSVPCLLASDVTLPDVPDRAEAVAHQQV